MKNPFPAPPPADQAAARPPVAVVIVGAGPRGSGLLERLIANVPQLLPGRRIGVHLVDPYPFGAGRIWRHQQSPLLWANSMAEDTTMFTDESCILAGPVRPGPSLAEWTRQTRTTGFMEPWLDAERAQTHGMSFPSRRLVTEYLAWMFWRTVDAAPANVTVHVHPDRVLDVTEDPEDPGGRQWVHLERAAEPLGADAVLLAMGHLPTRPLGPSANLARQAQRHGLVYLPEEYTADSDLSVLTPGQDVLIRGAGLAFIDVMVLLTQGRGGSFSQAPGEPDGTLIYTPSGQEPRLHVGSRRGVPYRSKLTYRLQAGPAPHLRFLTDAAVDRLLGLDHELDFRADVWPLLAKELALGHYHELFGAHPQRVRMTWTAFEAELARQVWDSRALQELVAEAVPDPADRFDPDVLDRPLRGVRLPDSAALQSHLLAHLSADVARRTDPHFSADLGVFTALLAVIEPLGRLLGSGRLSVASTLTDVPWFFGFFGYVASGPPPRRLQELAAAARAGVVRFLGADVQLRLDPGDEGAGAAFVASSPTVPGQVRATALIEARVPRASVSGSADPLLQALHARGEVTEQVLTDRSGGTRLPTGRLLVTPDEARVVDAAGRVHPRRWAFGSGTSAATAGAFSRPGTNAAFFRQNDTAARAVLAMLAEQSGGAASPERVDGPGAGLGHPRRGRFSVAGPGLDYQVEAVAGDHPDVATMLADLEREYSARYGRGAQEINRYPIASFQPPDGALLVMRENGRLVAGGAFMRHDEQTAELKRIWTLGSRRGRGLSRRIVAELEREAAARGYRRVYLTTGPRQPEARGLYLAMGYTALFDTTDDPQQIGPLPFEKALPARTAGLPRRVRAG